MRIRRVPAQRFERELLDGRIDDRQALRRNLQDMALANRLTLSNRSVLRRIDGWLGALPGHGPATILDVATGAGALPVAIRRWAGTRGYQVKLVASDGDRAVVGIARQMLRPWDAELVQHDALHMPFADNSVDIVTCVFSLHHFVADAAVRLLREMARVARVGVVVSDLRRTYGGYWGARLLALAPVSPLSRHDGPLSALRAYTVAEAQQLVEAAGINSGCVFAEPAFRLLVIMDKTDPLARA